MPHSSPHDSFVKALLRHPEAARDTVGCVLSPEAVGELDRGSLKLEPGSYIDEELASSHSDLLFSCTLTGKLAFIYVLIEHQAREDALMAFRVVCYCIGIWKGWLKNPGAHELPGIIPMVIHQGSKAWTAPINLRELIQMSPRLKEELGEKLPAGGFVLLDLSQTDVEKLRCGLLARLGLGMMQAVRGGQQIDWIHRHAQELAELLQKAEGPALVDMFLRYAFYTIPKPEQTASTLKQVAAKVMESRIRSKIMSFAEALQEEGRKKGREEGWQEGHRESLIQQIEFLARLLGEPAGSPDLWASAPLEELEQKRTELERRLEERLRRGT